MTKLTKYFKQLELGPMGNFVYFVGDPISKNAMVIDPGWEADEILHTLQEAGLTLHSILLTHAHPDHANEVEELLGETQAQLFMHGLETPRNGNWKSKATLISHEQILSVGALKIKVLHTPGHTPGSVCFLIEEALFTGDTLFIDSCGRTDLPGGNPQDLKKSFSDVLFPLEDDLMVYPGHNYGGIPFVRLGDQKRTNPFLQKNWA
jgi:hydroxyacylglutathione hydrolase